MRSLIVYDTNSRLALYTYNYPYPDGITDMLTSMGQSYVDIDTAIPLNMLYFDEDLNPCSLEYFSVTISTDSILDDGVETYAITGLPDNTTVLVDGASVGVFSSTFSMTSTEQGVYAIVLKCPFYVDYSTSVTVHD